MNVFFILTVTKAYPLDAENTMEETLNFLPLYINIISPVIFILLLIAILYWRTKSRASEFEHSKALNQVKENLEHEQRISAQATALADERKSEIQHLKLEISRLRETIDGLKDSARFQSNEMTKLNTQHLAEVKSAQEKIDLLAELRDDMQTKFKNYAEEALKRQSETFSKTNIEKLEATLTPLKEHVGHFEKELRQVHEETLKDRERLKAEIAQLSKRSETISQEAISLTKALKGDNQLQGAWGEMILENILERSGLREGEEYESQAHRKGADGERLRPDVVVRIPGEKTLVIDSKVSLVAYNDAANARDDQEAFNARKRHLASIKTHINALSAKGYHLAEASTVDYVILFVPIEGALSEALREDPTLTDYALERNITIATPTTLMMALKTVASVWAVERRNKNAELIADRAGRLYDKVASFVQSIEKIGERLDLAQHAYTQAFNQLYKGRGNVISQIEMLRTLGAKTNKRMVPVSQDMSSLQIDSDKK